MNMSVRHMVEIVGTVRDHDVPKGLLHRLNAQVNDDAIVTAVARELLNHRVLRIARVKVEQYARSHRIFESLRLKIEETMGYYFIAPEYSRQDIRHVFNLTDAIFIKGAAVAPLYPPGLPRDQADVDIMLHGFDSLWPLLNASRHLYRIDRLKLYTFPSERIGGSIDLIPITDYGKTPEVDVQIGSFHIWGSADYRPDIWKRAQWTPSGYVPSWEDTLLIIAAHAATQWVYCLRDINDIFVIITCAGAQLDWDYIGRVSRDENLSTMLEILLRETQRVYGLRLDTVHDLQQTNRCVTNLFAHKCWGTPARLTGLVMESIFTYERYRQDLPWRQALGHSVRNGYHMLRYDNRAYSAHESRIVRPLHLNEILILVPLLEIPLQSMSHLVSRPLGSPNFRIIHEGTPDEYFVSPYGVWVQASYHGAVTEETKQTLIRRVKADISLTHHPAHS